MRRPSRLALVLGLTALLTVLTVYAALAVIETVYEVPLVRGSIRFERPWAALLLLGVPLVLASAVFQHAGAPRLLFARTHDLALGRVGARVWIRDALLALRAVAITLFGVGLMGPQSIHARENVEVEGIDIILALDLSLSMQAADVTPNRFEGTKQVVDGFVLRRPDDRLGAVVFGRDAYTLSPLTTDKEALRSSIAELQLGMIDGRGTAIGNALGTALNRLRSSKAKSKIVILLTDGDSNAGNVSPDQAANLAKTMNVKVYTILMGVSSDTKVARGLGLGGRPLFDRGNFPVNPELLKDISLTTGGAFFPVADRAGLERSFHTILDRLEKSDIEDPGRVYGELFPAFLIPALVLLAIELALGTLVVGRWP